VGPEPLKHLRNIAILIALALIVWLVPGGGAASTTISNLLGIIFAGSLLFLGYRLYMEHRNSIFGLEERQRGILYASVAVAAIALVGTGRMWDTGGGTILWLVLMGGAAFGLYTVWQAYRSY
jgi:hypothetical protein